MKMTYWISAVALLLAGSATATDEAKKSGPSRESAPVACLQSVWASKDNPGQGLTAGQAIELCKGATDAKAVVQCFTKAWAHVDDGGLGLSAGQAIELCKASWLK